MAGGLFPVDERTPKQFRDRFRITWMEQWNQDYVDLDVEGCIEFREKLQGEFQFGTVQGWLDCRFGKREGKPLVEFSWQGASDNDDACGRGWAVLDGDALEGRIFIHASDDSAFKATRKKTRNRRT
ncbi:MAG: hypothetical protein HUU41_23025 [Bryobacteraceae bacterium]|nr:hypothetical protein [Bryobacteraceae bacterium]